MRNSKFKVESVVLGPLDIRGLEATGLPALCTVAVVAIVLIIAMF